MTESEAPQEPQKVAERKSKISSFLSHPAVMIIVFISAVIGLISLPLSFYFFYAAREYPQLTYYVSPSKAVVVKAGQSSRLTASFDGRVIDTDITVAQVSLWNAGSKSIKAADLLKPVVIHMNNKAPILEATIRKSSREVTQLALNTDELQKGRVSVSWNLLERNDGGVVQLIYAGDPSVKIDVEGVIEGQPQILEQSAWQTGEADRPAAFIFLILGVGYLLLYIYAYIKFGKRKHDWFTVALILIFLLASGFMFYITRDVGPPFGL